MTAPKQVLSPLQLIANQMLRERVEREAVFVRPLGVPVQPRFVDDDVPPADMEIEVIDTPHPHKSRFCADGPGHEWFWNEAYDGWVCGGCSAIGEEVRADLDEPETAHLEAPVEDEEPDGDWPDGVNEDVDDGMPF